MQSIGDTVSTQNLYVQNLHRMFDNCTPADHNRAYASIRHLQSLFNRCDRERHQLAARNRQLEEELAKKQATIDELLRIGNMPCEYC